jgi:hypothetical protein
MLLSERISLRNTLNCKFNGVQSGIATEAAFADELSAAKFRLAGRTSSAKLNSALPGQVFAHVLPEENHLKYIYFNM